MAAVPEWDEAKREAGKVLGEAAEWAEALQ